MQRDGEDPSTFDKRRARTRQIRDKFPSFPSVESNARRVVVGPRYHLPSFPSLNSNEEASKMNSESNTSLSCFVSLSLSSRSYFNQLIYTPRRIEERKPDKN
jgi:hypothetical protein